MNKRKKHELAILATDAYKFFHVNAYPEGTTNVYSNMTPRHNSYFKYDDHYIAFGTEMFVERFLIDYWNTHFFNLPIEEVIEDFNAISLGGGLSSGLTEKHVRELHELGYLPLCIKALPEGTYTKVGIPMLTVENTDARFFWLPNFIETQLLSETFPVFNAATIARQYKKIAMEWSNKTCENDLHIPWQFHDFSRRGQHGNDAGTTTAIGHLTSFMGSDSVQGALMADNFYSGDTSSGEVYGSVMATEHSVASSYGSEGEFDYYQSLIKKFPTGILSMVSDTYDYWNVLTHILPSLKKDILARDGKIVIRPDSGDILDVICGVKICHLNNFNEFQEELDGADSVESAIRSFIKYGDVYFEKGSILEYQEDYWIIDEIKYYSDENIYVKVSPYQLTQQDKGSLNLLWETFGGAVNSLGYKVLDSHIGLIYGDSVNLDNVSKIFKRMEEIGFASSNVVLGVGAYSYSYQNSRDMLATAFKTTSVTVNDIERHVQKDPKTDSKKKSAKGRVAVLPNGFGEQIVVQDLNAGDSFSSDLLEVVFKDGQRTRFTDFNSIRTRIDQSIIDSYFKSKGDI